MLSFYLIAFFVNLMMRHETQAWCGVTLRGMSRQQKHVPETKRSIAHAVLYWKKLIPFYQRISKIIFKICFSRSCLPSRATKQTYFGNFTRLLTHFGHPKLYICKYIITWEGSTKTTKSGWNTNSKAFCKIWQCKLLPR